MEYQESSQALREYRESSQTARYLGKVSFLFGNRADDFVGLIGRLRECLVQLYSYIYVNVQHPCTVCIVGNRLRL